jgi:hypothetical protein
MISGCTGGLISAEKKKNGLPRSSEQIPDNRIAWSSESGEYTSGVVDFAKLGPDRTQVALEISYDPKGFIENAGDASALFPDASKTTWSTSKNLSKTGVKKPAHGVVRLGKDRSRRPFKKLP